VVVKITEQANAQHTTDTNTSPDQQQRCQDRCLPGPAQTHTETGPNLNIGGSSTSSLQSSGDTARSESLTATVTAVVTKVFSNGNLFVEGHRVILVNEEEHHFYISGVVRPSTSTRDNSVQSYMVAEAQIEFVGRGVLSDNQKPGWLSRALGWMWPSKHAYTNSLFALLFTLPALSAAGAPVRIKDLVDVQGGA